jgi:hypothetical protein
VLDYIHLGSSVSLRSLARCGSMASVLGMARFGSNLSVLDFLHLGSSLSLRRRPNQSAIPERRLSSSVVSDEGKKG